MKDEFDDPKETASKQQQVPEWVLRLADLHRDWQEFSAMEPGTIDCSKEFLSLCVAAGAVALSLRKYAAYAESIGFAPISFAAYLQRLEELTQTPAEPTLRHFGITNREHPDAVSVTGFARLWRALGRSMKEALVTLRVTLLAPERMAFASVRLRDGTNAMDPLESCEAELRELERQLNATQLLEARMLESELVKVYAETKQE